MRSARTLVAVLVCVLAFGALNDAAAQSQSKPAQFIQVVTTTIRPAATIEYEDYVKKLNAARDKTAGAPLAFTSAVTLGGPNFTYVTVLPFERWADRERWPVIADMLTKVYGQAEASRLLKTARESYVSQGTEVFAYLANATTNPKVFDPPAPFVNVQITEVHPEMNAAYGACLNKIKTAQEKAKFPFSVQRRIAIQGTNFTYGQATAYSKLSDRDQQIQPGGNEALRQAFGEAEANQCIDITARAIKARRTIFLTYRADLSRAKATLSN